MQALFWPCYAQRAAFWKSKWLSARKELLTNPLVVRHKKRRQIHLIAAKPMPPKRSKTLTEAELRLMKILWERGESAVADVVAAMPGGSALAYTSVLTTIRVLESKGYLRHRQQGRAFLYSPCVGEDEAGRSEVLHMLQRFFGNSRERLLQSMLGDGDLTPQELKRLKELIAATPDDSARQA